MKVIKRDGRAVEFDKDKIKLAIEKANKEVKGNKIATEKDINKIINYIEDLDKKRILVEDIQDVIEEKLMEYKKFELAKRYIVYRYTRALVRKQNTTDESILGLIKSGNQEINGQNINSKQIMVVSKQRDSIAGEVSKDLTKRMLLPEKITKAHDEGILYFHDAEYFIQPMYNSSFINIEDMLDNGTVINNKFIETPQSFQVACIVMTQIISAISGSQYGNQIVNIQALGKYLRKSYEKIEKDLEEEEIPNKKQEKMLKSRLEKELIAGVQSIQYQINTLITINGQDPLVTLMLNIDENDEYIQENLMIISEIFKQRIQGMKNEIGEYITPKFPKLLYVLYYYNSLNGGKYDYITEQAIECSKKALNPSYISSKRINKNVNGKFNQGIVTINLPQIGIISNKDENTFWNLLDERLDLCYEALMCRHYALIGTLADISPIHWKYGAISRLKSGEKIDKLLKDKNSSISLGYVGLYNLANIMKQNEDIKTKKEFEVKVLKYLNEKIKNWNNETKIQFELLGINNEKIQKELFELDQENYGEIKEFSNLNKYNASYYIDENTFTDTIEKLKLESDFQKNSSKDTKAIVNIKPNEDFNEIIKFTYNNNQYIEFK